MKVVSVINMKGGVGKTTLAINIADFLSRRKNKKILVVDVDPQFNATQCVFKPQDYVDYIKKSGDTILNVFDSSIRPVAGAVDGISKKHPKIFDDIKPYNFKKNFDILPGNLELYRLEMAPGGGRENRLNLFLKNYEKNNLYDFVIIDTPPTPSVWMTSALIASEYYVIPVKPDPISFTGIDLLRSIIEDKKENFNLKISCAGLVLTMVEVTTKVYQEAKYFAENDRHWKDYLYKTYLPKRTEVAHKQATQKMILDCNNAEIKSSLSGIVTELLERVK